jgi:hypothetical protein
MSRAASLSAQPPEPEFLTVDLHIGTWIFPLAITIGSVGWSLFGYREAGSGHQFAAIGAGVISLLFVLGAIIVSLLSWLVWAILIG